MDIEERGVRLRLTIVDTPGIVSFNTLYTVEKSFAKGRGFSGRVFGLTGVPNNVTSEYRDAYTRKNLSLSLSLCICLISLTYRVHQNVNSSEYASIVTVA